MLINNPLERAEFYSDMTRQGFVMPSRLHDTAGVPLTGHSLLTLAGSHTWAYQPRSQNGGGSMPRARR